PPPTIIRGYRYIPRKIKEHLAIGDEVVFEAPPCDAGSPLRHYTECWAGSCKTQALCSSNQSCRSSICSNSWMPCCRGRLADRTFLPVRSFTMASLTSSSWAMKLRSSTRLSSSAMKSLRKPRSLSSLVVRPKVHVSILSKSHPNRRASNCFRPNSRTCVLPMNIANCSRNESLSYSLRLLKTIRSIPLGPKRSCLFAGIRVISSVNLSTSVARAAAERGFLSPTGERAVVRYPERAATYRGDRADHKC